MKASFVFDKFSKKLVFANHAISSRSQLPILLNFLFIARDGKFRISSTDLEIGLETEIPAKIEKEGEVCIPAKSLMELVSISLSEKVLLEATPEGLVLIGEKIKTVFQTTPPKEFPKLYGNLGEKILTIAKKSIDKEFSRVVFAASLDSERPALSGVLIKDGASIGEKGFFLVATDGYRLSLQKKALSDAILEKKESLSVIVPSRVIRELQLMCKEEEGEGVDVFIPQGNNQVVFSLNNTKLIGRLIEAEFPNYEKIIPSDFSLKSVFDKTEFQKAIKTCFVFARQSANIVKLSLRKEKIVISSSAPSLGSSVVEIEAQTTGEENEIAFNARYLLDFCANIESDNISFEMTGPLNPGVFKIERDESYLHLIMPIRIQQEG